jgi:hypothetical protein
VYLAARTLAADIKVSLHESGQWQHSFSAEFASRHSMPNRQTVRWARPPDLSPGVTLAYRLIVPWSSVTLPYHAHSVPSDVVWVPQPPEGCIVEFQIWITAPDAIVSSWPGRRSRGTVLVGKVNLPNGETVWVTALQEAIPDAVLEQVRHWRKFWNSQEVAKRSEFHSGTRALLFGEDKDGSRTYVDIDLTAPQLSS